MSDRNETTRDDVETIYQRAAVSYRAGRVAEAEGLSRRVLEMKDGHAGASQLLGLVALGRGAHAEAVELLGRAVEFEPREPMYHYNLGLALHASRQPEAALAAYVRAVHLNPGFVEAQINRGIVLRNLGRTEEALAVYEDVVRRAPERPKAHFNLGNTLGSLGRTEEALVAYDEVLRLQPDFAPAHNNRANVLRRLGREEEALAAYEQALRLLPGNAEVHNSYGNLLSELGRYVEALAAYERALAINPHYVEAHNNKYCLAAMGTGEMPSRSPEQFIIQLFDSCADEFDSRLVGKLKYQVPWLLFDAVSRLRGDDKKKMDILDLGCGTGLCGVAFSGFINRLVGVDLAPRMLDKAAERGVYTDFIQSDVCRALEQCGQSFDLVLSADVFIYIGDIGEVFDLVARRLRPGGLFAFSIEVDEHIQDFELRPSVRYVHSPAYIDRLARAGGFEELYCCSITVRYECGQPVAGSLIVLRLPE